MDKFKRKLYAEFESNCFKIFGVPGARVHEVLSERGDDLFGMYDSDMCSRFNKDRAIVLLHAWLQPKTQRSVDAISDRLERCWG